MNYSVGEIANIVSGNVIGDDQISVSEVYFDSRKIGLSDNGLFVAIVSDKSDGHDFAQECYLKGVRVFMVSKPLDLRGTQILVDDTLMALQKLAAHHRSTFGGKVIGITGSNGKTTVKERLFSLLKDHFNVFQSPKSFNSQIGVPLSLLKLKAQNDLALIEAGISKQSEMSSLEEMVKPEIGILTHLGDAHDSGFSSRSVKLKEKLVLFRQANLLIFPYDLGVATTIREELPKIRLVSWSRKNQECDLFISSEKLSPKATQIELRIKGQSYQLEVPFSDKASLDNLYTCLALAMVFEISMESTFVKIKSWQSLDMRLKIETGLNDCNLINDSYNADWDSLSVALEQLKTMDPSKSNVAILSELEESFDNQNFEFLRDLLHSAKVDIFIGIGHSFGQTKVKFAKSNYFFDSTEDFLHGFRSSKFKNNNILIKGRRSFHFERIYDVLKRSSHEALLEVDLSAVIHNYNTFKMNLKRETKVLAMVKAFSYGTGALEISKILEYHQVDYLGVAYPDEGIQLRENGISTPIMVMNPDIGSFNKLIDHNLEPEIFDFSHLDVLIKFLEARNATLPIHLKLETGMNRLGFQMNQLDDLISLLKSAKSVKIASIFSHLAQSDQKDDSFTHEQFTRFESMSEIICNAFGSIPRHILNTDGVINYTTKQYEMVRLGIGLYGYCSDASFSENLEVVSSFKTRVSHIKNVGTDETIGYGRTGRMIHEGRIAIIPVGYADGLDRHLGNGKWKVMINDKLYPTIGNICMDMSMIEIDASVNIGDEVIIFGKKPTINEMSSVLGTIPYEILTKPSRRVRRVYFKD
ncbi:MAG: bifunctional UDP-N-acetylmuramoyl-tripeptide:D-alanyl-D-alanine ligase/alanine racemase [Flavobacteriales bacterium]|nr:bifunctional UDP-N-acetylmuramoyl-tripeptide:D-alanyl-D-alanine ligase/alanine racemase [Flavobacteriales bacterium]